MATTGLRSGNRSGYRGVSWYARSGKWRAHFHLNGKYIHLGYFDDVHDAGIAASDFRLQREAELEANQERGRQRKRAAVIARLSTLTSEERRERVRNNFVLSFEERSRVNRKAWRTRRKAIT